MIGNFPDQTYFSTKYSTKMQKNTPYEPDVFRCELLTFNLLLQSDDVLKCNVFRFEGML